MKIYAFLMLAVLFSTNAFSATEDIYSLDTSLKMRNLLDQVSLSAEEVAMAAEVALWQIEELRSSSELTSEEAEELREKVLLVVETIGDDQILYASGSSGKLIAGCLGGGLLGGLGGAMIGPAYVLPGIILGCAAGLL